MIRLKDVAFQFYRNRITMHSYQLQAVHWMQKRELDVVSSLDLSHSNIQNTSSVTLPIEGVINCPHIIAQSAGGLTSLSLELWTPLVVLRVQHSDNIPPGSDIKSPRSGSIPVDVCYYTEEDIQRIVHSESSGVKSGTEEVLMCIW